MSTIIKAQELSKYYNRGKDNEVKALQDVSFEINSGELVAIVGPSGSGKSTLMHILGVLDSSQSGSLTIRDTDVSKVSRSKLPKIRAQEIGFIFQGFNLLATQTAFENVYEAAIYGGMSKKAAKKTTLEMLELVGLSNRINNFPNQLSGGQQQRVAIARALINKPAIILGDEPTGELDSQNASMIMDLLIKLNREQGQTIIIVTHNLDLAEQCRTIIRMQDGKIAEIRTKEPHV